MIVNLLCMLMTDDFSCLQNDVSHIQSWSSLNALTFNGSKCKQMLLSRKKKPTVCIPMVLNGQPLQIFNSFKYLGLMISSDLGWSTHIQYICSKAKKMLSILYRQFSSNATESTMVKLYLSQVRPLLEYGVEVWHPYLSKDTQALENVQKFALRICSNNWQANYHDLLEHYNLPTLENRRLYLSLCTFFKIVHKLCYFPASLIYHLIFHSLLSVLLILIISLFLSLVLISLPTLSCFVLLNYGITYLQKLNCVLTLSYLKNLFYLYLVNLINYTYHY